MISGSQPLFTFDSHLGRSRTEIYDAATLETLAEVPIRVPVLDHVTPALRTRLEIEPGSVIHNRIYPFPFQGSSFSSAWFYVTWSRIGCINIDNDQLNKDYD